MLVDAPVGRVQGSVAEVRRPAADKAVQSVAHMPPEPVSLGREPVADLAFDPRQVKSRARCASRGERARESCPRVCDR